MHCAADKTCWHDGQDPVLDLSVAVQDLGDLSTPERDLAFDLANSDLTGNDLATPNDLQSVTMTYPASAEWTSAGGGSCVGSNGSQLNLSVGGGIVVGGAVASGGAQITFTYFSSDTR